MEPYRKYFFSVLLITSIIFGALLFWPFLTTLIVGIALSVVFHPVYRWIKKQVKFSALASFFTVTLFLITLCVPLFLIAGVVFHQAQGLYVWISDYGSFNTLVQNISEALSHILPPDSINIEEKIAGALSQATTGIATMFTATLSTIFSMLLVTLIMFYFLKDGPEWKRIVIHASPLSEENNEKIISRLKNAITGVMRGYLFVGIAQGLLMGAGLYIFGVPNAALWGVLAAIASMVPTIGTALIAVPAIIFLFAVGHTASAVGLIAWSVLLVGTIDNMLNPFIVGKKIDLHPLLVLFSVLGGVALMGPVGVLIGPLIISFIYALTSVYKSEMS